MQRPIRALIVGDQADPPRRHLLAAAGAATSPYTVRTDVDVAVLARFSERFADPVASVALRLCVATRTVPDRP
jgi:hypothetical protein